MARVCLEFNLLCCHATPLETPGLSSSPFRIYPLLFHLTHFYYKSISLHCLYWPASIQMLMHSLSFYFSRCHTHTAKAHSFETLSHMFAGIAELGSNLDHYIKLPTCRAKRRAAFLQYLIRILRISQLTLQICMCKCTSDFVLVFKVYKYQYSRWKAPAGLQDISIQCKSILGLEREYIANCT